jgi:hypothetical protein
MSRWVWLSSTGDGSGSGLKGSSCGITGHMVSLSYVQRLFTSAEHWAASVTIRDAHQ